MDINQKNKNRFAFLELLYKESKGDTRSYFSMWEVGKALNLDRSETSQIVDYLIEEHLLEARGLGGTIGLTHYGVKEVEQSHSDSHQSTEHFSPVKTTIVGEDKSNSQVFLCHASDDKEAVRELNKKLKAAGIKTWLDEDDLIAGQEWEYAIAEAVKASEIVLVCLSQSSINKDGFVNKEIKFALDKADEKPQGKIYLIPVRLEECEVPSRLKRWHWVDLFKDNGYKKLLEALPSNKKDESNDKSSSQKVNDNRGKIVSELMYFSENTQPQFDTVTKLFKTSFLFGSESGIGLYNPEVNIRFDKEFEKANGAVVGQGFAAAGNLRKQEDSEKRGYMIKTDFLNPGNFLLIEIFSKEIPKIENLTTKP